MKPEDMVHHPPMDQLQGFEYCIDSNPSWGLCHLISQPFGSSIFYPVICVANPELCVSVAGEAIALGFQHYILSLGTAVMIPTMLVPLMGGNDVRISSSCFLCLLGSSVSLVQSSVCIF